MRLVELVVGIVELVDFVELVRELAEFVEVIAGLAEEIGLVDRQTPAEQLAEPAPPGRGHLFAQLPQLRTSVWKVEVRTQLPPQRDYLDEQLK